MAESAPQLGLFSAYGIEAEYMIVSRDSLNVLPISDEVMKAVAGKYVSDVEDGPIAWSNELVLHVVEIKCNGPRVSLSGLASDFHSSVRRINDILKPFGGQLLPTAMHPWMDPLKDSKLWPHDSAEIYGAFDRIFSCKGHGWSNLQSVHINLPFADDKEFAALHAAIRIVLPLIPALCASSPIVEGRPTGIMDSRLDFYRRNQQKVPVIAGDIVPEPVFSRADYDARIFQEIYKAIKPHDPEGILQFEWLNSRGAIARFDRNAIEIRLVDIQESPAADLAVVALITAVIKGLVAEYWCTRKSQMAWETAPLKDILLSGIKDGDDAMIDNSAYLNMFGVTTGKMTAGELWRKLVTDLEPRQDDAFKAHERDIQTVTKRGCLARAILKSLNGDFAHDSIRSVYKALGECLAHNTIFK